MIRSKAPPGFSSKILASGRRVFFIKKANTDILILHEDVKTELKRYVKFSNQFDCVKKHLRHKSRFFWKIDLRKAFDHITLSSVENIKNFPDYIRHCPDLFFHKNKGLIQGAPASSYIFQFFCQNLLDPELKEFCKKNEIMYTRFADDILFSSRTSFGKSTRERIRDMIRIAGFQINEKKEGLVDNFHAPVTYIGMRIFRGKVSSEKRYIGCEEEDFDDPQTTNRINGHLSWEKSVLALNR